MPADVSAFLAEWVGVWPPLRPVHLGRDPHPDEPTWDGSARGVLGVADPDGGAVLRAPEEVAARLASLGPHDVPSLLAALPGVVGRPGVAGRGVLRWAVDVPSVSVLPDAGIWLPAALGMQGDPRVEPWLVPFGGDVLIALDEEGVYLSGVGLKRHNDLGWEISVGTTERARGRGLAKRLVAQAARYVLDQGRVVTYLHAEDNVASAKVAQACGFPDGGWGVLGFWEMPD